MTVFDDHVLSKSPFRRLIPSLYRRLDGLGLRRHSIKTRYGLQFLLDKTNLVDRSMKYRFGWEGEKFEKFIARAQDCFGDQIVFLDVGAHWGLYAIRVSQLPCFDEIHAFEPDKRNRAQLYGNLFLNALEDRITVHPYAVSDTTGELSFLMARPGNRGVSRIVEETASGQQIVTVQSERLDDHFDYKNREIAIKVDVEGAEAKALSGMKDLISNNKVILMVEIHPENYASTVPVLEDLGLTLSAELSDTKGETDYLFKNF